MTHFIRRLCSALFLVTCFSYSNAQEISTTGELITNTQSAWQGCSTAQSAGFWGGSSGGPCPGIWTNNEPYNGAQIIFSYGQYTLSQSFDLATILPNETGLQINGYNYHWHVKNSNINGAQPGSYDPIAYVDITLYNKDGSVAIKDTYDYGYHIPSWATVTGTRTYDNPYSLTLVDTIQLSVTSMDSGYWAGYYGPEFMHFGLTVNYSVDPCSVNILSSPSCPGYLEYIASLSSTPSSAVDTEAANQPTAAADGVTAAPAAQQTAATGEQSSTSATAESQSSGGSGAPLSTILNILGREQARIATVERSTVESSAEQSVREADRATEQAEAIAAATVMDSIDASISSAQNQMAQDQQQADQSSGSGLNVFSSASLSILPSDAGVGFRSHNPVNEQLSSVNPDEERTDSAVSFSGFSAVNVVREENTDSSDDTQNSESTETVKQNVANNELAGDISLASLGAVPQGFDAYSSMMPDGSFYAPREIYRGQRNVDNARALRGLGTDRLHQEMVNQQYNQGAR